MKKKKRTYWKLIFLFICICFLGIILFQEGTKKREKIPENEGVKIEKVQLQLKALFTDFETSDCNSNLEVLKQEKEELTKKGFEEILTYLQMEEKINADVMTKQEWAKFFEELLKVYDKDGSIQKVETIILGTKENIKGNDESFLEENQVLTEKGIFLVWDDMVMQHKYQPIWVYQKEGEIISYEGEGKKEFVWNNSWIAEAGEKEILVLSGKWLVTIPYEHVKTDMREQLSDIYFKDGKIIQLKAKSEKINGKLLAFTNDTIEIAGRGSFLLSENMRIYKLYERLEEKTRTDLAVGLEFTDFVIEDDKIVACLITQREELEKIRVLLKTADFAGNYHEQVVFCSDSDITIKAGEQEYVKKAGEEIKIDYNCEYFKENRILIIPEALTAKTTISTIHRSQGIPVYRGSFEIEKSKEGLLLINELPLEEYLYAVVPSEMPASYPKEALKAQAICARTYAYRNLNNAAMAAFGANVDDSVAYQVYNNIVENNETTSAVKETQGKIIRYQGELAGTYYYSTSCGYGSNIEVWAGNSAQDYPYLKGKKIGETISGNAALSADDIKQEKDFLEFIQTANPADWESQEGWYRWEYEVAEIKEEALEERIKERYPLETIKPLGRIKNISITKRNQGGIAEELLIEGTKSNFLVQKEYNIRYVLSDRNSDIKKQNGESVKVGNLIPSAYIALFPKKDGKYITGYDIKGGGYGHGVGMSQNGAKGMALFGYECERIIEFFYEGAAIEMMYP